MIFTGISRTFSTKNGEQYITIGSFWDEMSALYGRENLRGLGYNWTEDTIEYVIGLRDGVISGADCNVRLPDSGWKYVSGKTEDLGNMYTDIYCDGALTFEIEMFGDDGSCTVAYCRENVK